MKKPNRRTFLGSTAALAGATTLAIAGEQQEGSEETSSLGKTPHTKFAVNIEMWFGKLPFLDRIRQSAALGFPAVEFWPWHNKPLDETAALCQELAIEVTQFTAWGFSPGLNEVENHAKFVERIKAGCQAAEKLNCKMMTVGGGNDVAGMTQKQMHENIIAGLKLAAPIAEEHGVMLILEPMNIRVDHKGHCLYGSPPAIRICQEIGSAHVKINWDLYHMQITEGDLCGHLREGFKAGQIGYLQLADHPGRNEPGTGEVHYNRVLKEAYDLGYRGYVGLECRPREDETTAARLVAAADVW